MVEGQESLHTAVVSTGYLCSATVFMSRNRKNKTVLIFHLCFQSLCALIITFEIIWFVIPVVSL